MSVIIMDSEAHTRVTPAERVAIISAGCCADMAINFPLWIVAKRVSAGLGLPAMGEIYKGSTSLLFAIGPMILVQDSSTAFLLRCADGRIESPTVAHASAACVSGAVGALAVGAQIEAVITRAHATKQTIWQAAKSLHESRGFVALAAPYGAVAMVGREMPYAGCLFFLSGWIRDRLREGWPDADARGAVLRDMLGATLTAAVAGPLSQAPSVVAAHQQAHQVSLAAACRTIGAAGGLRGFFSGLLPRTASLAGSLFVMPFSVETLQPMVERMGRTSSR